MSARRLVFLCLVAALLALPAVAAAKPGWSRPRSLLPSGERARNAIVQRTVDGNVILWDNSGFLRERAGSGPVLPLIGEANTIQSGFSLATGPAGHAVALFEDADSRGRLVEGSFLNPGQGFGAPQLLLRGPDFDFAVDRGAPRAGIAEDGETVLALGGQVAIRAANGNLGQVTDLTPSGTGDYLGTGVLGVDRLGNALSVWSVYDQKTTTSTLLSARRPAGGSFEPARVLGRINPFYEEPRLAMSADGQAVFVYAPSREDRLIAMFAEPGGDLGRPHTVGPGAKHPSVGIADDGSAILVWRSLVGARKLTTRSVVTAAFRPPGGRFGRPVHIGGKTFDPPALAVSGKRVVVAWSAGGRARTEILAATGPIGGPLGEPVVIRRGRNLASPGATAGPDGRVLVYWRRGAHIGPLEGRVYRAH